MYRSPWYLRQAAPRLQGFCDGGVRIQRRGIYQAAPLISTYTISKSQLPKPQSRPASSISRQKLASHQKSPAMASNPPGLCCYKGVKHEGETKGEMKLLGDIECYYAYPENKSTEYGILILTDVIGHKLINAQLIADQFAANGYFVMMPDLFHGDPIPLNRPGDFDIQTWFQGSYQTASTKIPHTAPIVDPIVDTCIVAMRTEHNCKKIGAVGYCFGAKYVVRHLLPASAKIDVGYCAHPSFVEEAELRDMRGPLAIAAAETDAIFPEEKRKRTEEILKEMGATYQINLYSGVEHGFAVRGDMSKRQNVFAKESAFLMALTWFEEYLK